MAATSTRAAMPSASITIPGATTRKASGSNAAARIQQQHALDSYSPVNQNGSFEFDRVIKSGYLQKRTQKTKKWKSVYLVLRPDTLYIYRSDKEDRLRHKVYTAELTAVTLLKDPKQKRDNVFGLYSPSKNFHLQAASIREAQEWVDLIRTEARVEEEEEEMFLSSPITPKPAQFQSGQRHERFMTSSPEPQLASSYASSMVPPVPANIVDSSGMSGAELASHSDFSDTDIARIHALSVEGLGVQATASPPRPFANSRKGSQQSIANHAADRIVWQGWMWWLKSKGGVRQWKNCWAVLRPRNLILYRDESEYAVQFLIELPAIIDVVDIDPISRTKAHCLQIITEEKSYRFCAHDEEALVRCLGAFKSLLAKRRELEARAAMSA